jgi:phytoene dehydrogenase-like protein
MALNEDDHVDRSTGDLLFSSTADRFKTDLLLSRDITSRTFSFYYPDTRPNKHDRTMIVSSTNANYADWTGMSKEDYDASKADLVETTLDALEKYLPNARQRVEHAEAATPVTFEHYTKHIEGASFGTKFEGLAVSRALPEQITGLYHAGSCGIIMSGWLGTINYGVIVANDVENMLHKQATSSV